MQKYTRLPQLTLALIALFILTGVIIFRPFWGLMDDATHTFVLVPALERDGIVRGAWNYAVNDLEWGMFRPAYALMVYPLYKPGMLWGAGVTFFLTAIFSLFSLAYCTTVLAKMLGVSREWALVAVGAFFYAYDLFQHPSLQEKLVILSGAALLRLSWGPMVGSKFTHLLLFALAFLVGFGTKASFMIYFSIAFWAFFSARREQLLAKRSMMPWLQLGVLVVAGVIALIFLAVVSSRGGYTNVGYSAAKILPNLISLEGIFFVTPLIVFVVWVLREPAYFWSRPERLTAFLGVLAFLVIFLPWGIKAYVQSVIAPVYCCLCVQLAEGFFRRIPARVWQIPLAALAIATAAYRIPSMFIRLHDIGLAVEAMPSWERKGITEIYVPCMEGAESMRGFAKFYTSSQIKVSRLDNFQGLEGKAVFYDLALCPLPGRARTIPGCSSQENIFEGGLEKSFKLARGFGCS